MTPIPAPCACGHAHRFGSPCEECACTRFCPNYVAQAKLEGREVTKALRRYQQEVQWSMGWTPPSTLEPRACAYCDREFRPQRPQRTTCSGACRVAMHRALAYTTDEDVPVASSSARRETVSAERRAATGVGLMTARESYEADLRVRARARE